MKNKTKSGFSLLEATIVLSIVGVALGGVWAVVGSIRDAVMAHQMVEQYVEIAKKVRLYYTTRPIGNNVSVTSAQTGPLTIDFLPESMCDSRCSSANAPTDRAFLKMPFMSMERGIAQAQLFAVNVATYTIGGANWRIVRVRYSSSSASFSNLTKGACIRAINEIDSRWEELALVKLDVTGAPGVNFIREYTTTTSPLDPSMSNSNVLAVCSNYPTSTSKRFDVLFSIVPDR